MSKRLSKIWRSFKSRAGLKLGILAAAAFAAAAQAQVPIRISVQPANYAALPVHVATQNDYWKQVGLSPSFVRYTAGLPQVKAHADWDFGIAGAVPALIGAKDFNLITIAMADDQSRTNALLARKELVQKIRADRAIPKGSKIAVTLNSTGDYALLTCMALWGGVSKADMLIQGGSQADIMQAGISGAADILALWAPNNYSMQEKHGYEQFCNAKDFGSGVYSAVFTGREFATSRPEVVEKFLAVMLRSINWIKANPKQAQALFISNALKEGVVVSPLAAKSDYEQRPLFNLDEQLKAMGETKSDLNDSPAGRSFYAINVFLNDGKAGTKNMRPSAFVDISHLIKIKNDATLSKIARDK